MAFTKYLHNRKNAYDYFKMQNELVDFLKSIDPAPKHQAYHNALLKAMEDQREFFKQWDKEGANFKYKGRKFKSHPKARSSHRLLLKAYGILMKKHSPQGNNKKAFFDYHCALDLI